MNIETNKLIAEFMGAVHDAETTRNDHAGTGDWFKGFEEYTHPIHESSLEYHSSWDWLMPVVEKIETLITLIDEGGEVYCVVTIEDRCCRIYWGDSDLIVQWQSESKIKSTYKAVVEFIKQYNENLESCQDPQ